MVIGCSEKKPEKSINEPSKSEEVLINEVINNGNTDSFDELLYASLDNTMPEYMLPYAIIMANKYKYDRAALQVYRIFCDLSNHKEFDDLSNLDEETRKLAIKYLIKASLTNFEAKEIYAKHLIEGIYVKKDIEAGKKLLKEVEAYNNSSH
ncbi:hypothetical protein GCM10027442_50700 [Emticicia fontis]